MGDSFDLRGIDAEQIGRLMDALAHTDVEELEIEQGRSRLSVRRAVREGSVSAGPGDGVAGTGEPTESGPCTVQSPAVGIFYRSERRSAPPQVEVGARVKAGDILGWIEVMAVPHGVFSTCEGVVESFLVEDGQPVEYGQPLASVRPLGAEAQQPAIDRQETRVSTPEARPG